MRIVLVTHYYPPEVNAPAQRSSSHAKFWRQAGHDVTIITTAPSHPFGIVYDGYENRTMEETVDGIRVLRLKTLLSKNSGTLKRSLNFLSFLISVIWNLNKVGPADVVIATSPQFFAGIAGYFVARKAKAPWILEIRDIWPESIIAVGASKPNLMTRALAKICDWAYQKADRIVSVSPGFAPHFEKHGVAHKTDLITNGYEGSIRPKPATFDDFPEIKHFEGKFIAGYVGTLGMSHGLITLVRAAKILENDNIAFVMVGAGAMKEEIEAEIAKLGVTNLVMLGQKSREDVMRIFSLIDVSVVNLVKTPLFKTVIPTKLIEGMAMGKPMVLGVEGVARDILQAGNAGIAFEPEDPQAMSQAILKIAQNPDLAKEFSESGQAHAVEHYDREVLAKRYVGIMETAIQSRG